MSKRQACKRKKARKPKPLMSSPLAEASLQVLVDELKSRSIGCVVAVLGIGSRGDFWRYDSKGSADMAEQLIFGLQEKFLADDSGGSELVKRNS